MFRIVSLPKPTACAILLGVALFPRRGDELRDETAPFYQQLCLIASGMMVQAEIARVPQENIITMQRPLKAAQDILKYRFYGPERLAIVGEYIHKWCDFACFWYANYARVALYRHGGLLSDRGEYDDLWEWLSSPMPTADELRVLPDE